ncbi:hypothetical protein [Paucisalibacillus sp. EB02]|nr:hypothetical protein [Paucisalibacillus sp. EB02]
MLDKKWLILAIIIIFLIGVYLSLRLNTPLESSEEIAQGELKEGITVHIN